MRRQEVRLVTLAGPGGIGKTRLAIQVAEELGELFADGTYFVDLSPVSNPTLVVPTIAQKLGIREGVEQSLLQRLKEGLQAKQVLLLLDNFEQVLGAAVQIADLLTACPQLKVIVTSREKLHVRAEQEFSVPPLALPDTTLLPDVATLAQCEAVALFLQRAQAAQHEFEMTITNASAIAEICVHLDGLPLAIELAAARIKLLNPQALLARLSPRVALLTGGARDAPARQLTLRNNIEWSYRLLDASEQRLFRSLAVFVGGCTLEAAEAVCAALSSGNGVVAVLDGVASLIDKSLLQQTEQEGKEPRLRLLETIREYGLECLTASGEIEVTRQAHAAYYLRLAEEAVLVGPLLTVWLERLEREHENLRASLTWLLDQAEDEKAESSRELALRLSAALRRFWDARGHYSEGRTFMERSLAGGEGAVTFYRIKTLKAAASMAVYHYDTEWGEALCKEILTLSGELGDTDGVAHTLYLRGIIAGWRKDLATACSLLEEALELWRELGDKDGIAWALHHLAIQVRGQCEYSKASALSEESLTLHRALGDTRGIAFALFESATIHLVSQGDQATVRALLEESLTLARKLGDKRNMSRCFTLLGEVSLQQGDINTARSLAEQSLGLCKKIGDQDLTAGVLCLLGKVNFVQGDYTAARALYEESLASAERIDGKVLLVTCLEGLARVVAAQGKAIWAVRLWGAAESLRETIGAPIPPVYRTDYKRSVATIRTQLGEKPFAIAWAEGRIMTPAQAVAIPGETSQPSLNMTRPQLSPWKQKASHLNGLTVRELEVLRLVAHGLTDAQIARQLVISPRTVNTHLVAIFGKIQVSSRSACTRFAFEHHLV
jgi:predicted ATPase/DNA-binding CsgD family transcriptional regulator